MGLKDLNLEGYKTEEKKVDNVDKEFDCVERFAKDLVLWSLKIDETNDLFDKQPAGSIFHTAYKNIYTQEGPAYGTHFAEHLKTKYEITFPLVF